MNAPPQTVTIPALLARNIDEHGDRTALLLHDGQAYAPKTWSELGHDVYRLAAAFAAHGVQPGDRLATIMDNGYAWIVVDLACLAAGVVHVPIHATLSPAQMAFEINHSQARLAILGGREQADALATQRDALPDDCRYVVVEDWSRWLAHALSPGTLEEFTSRVTPEQVAAARDAAAQIEADALATIMYTSGTTGEPKGVMLTQGNLASNAVATADAVGSTDEDLRLCFLPLSHVYARTCDLYTWIYRTSVFALARCRETILEDLALVQPTVLNGVPYFYEKLLRNLRAAGKDTQPGMLKKVLGGRVEYCFCGGAALPEHVRAFFDAHQVALLEGYGLSETSPVISASGQDAVRPGAVGKTIPGVEVRIADDGEIMTRGPHVMRGYWRDEAATREILRDGWLHTGDLGQLDADGFLSITGRKKEILVTASGKNIVPAHLESLLTASPLILQAVVLGEGRNYLVALIVPDADAFKAAMRAHRVRVFSKRAALNHPTMQDLYRAEIDRALSGVSRHEQIRKFMLLGRGFSPESGEMTPKASLKREVIATNLAKEIEGLYAAES